MVFKGHSLAMQKRKQILLMSSKPLDQSFGMAMIPGGIEQLLQALF